jgi:hypothetical protein
MLKHLLITLSLILFALTGAAQGWERIVSGGAQDGGQAVVATQDGGYALTGYYGFNRVLVTKTDVDGRVQWSKNLFGSPSIGAGTQIVLMPNGDLVICGWMRAGLGQPANGFVARLDAYGTLLWSQLYGSAAGEDQLTDMILLSNGDLLLSGYYEQINGKDDFWALTVDGVGNKVTDLTYGQWDQDERANGLVQMTNGDVVLAGEISVAPDKDVLVMRIAPDGNSVWSSSFGFDFSPSAFSSDRALDVALAADGNIVVCGVTNATTTSGGGGLILKINANGSPIPVWFSALASTPFKGMQAATGGGFFFTGLKEISSTFEDLLILKTDENGAQIWQRTVGKGGTDNGMNVINTPDGGALAVGIASTNLSSQDSYAYLVKTDALGRVYTNVIEGFVFQDNNASCDQNSGELGLEDWIVKIVSADNTRYATTNSNGYYSVTVDTGDHLVSVLPFSQLWEACQDEYPINMAIPLDTTDVTIPVRAQILCPRNEIDVQAAQIRQCAENIYHVRYCNTGTFPSVDTKIDVILDPAMTYVSSSIAPAVVIGDTVRFAIGYVEKNQCNSFSLTAFLRCDSILTGQTHCVTAHITPDSICTPGVGWDGAIIKAKAKCINNEVKLQLENRGTGDMIQTQEFIVIEDVLEISAPTQFRLTAGQDSTVYTTPANGKTYRIIAMQSPGYPGESYPTAAIEGCKTDSMPVSLGYYTMFPDDDADPFISTNCIESISQSQSISSFIKSGHPKGYTTDHYITPENDLTYVIRFSNTTTDTVQTVTVRDTLSAYLDPATVFPGAASHGYQFEVLGSGVIQFILSNTDLFPDGSAPETRSSGFVSFRVAQKPNLPCETKILNRAAVTFDFQAPEVTDQVFHTVCPQDSFITVSTEPTLIPGATVTVFPNPFTDWVVFDLENVPAKQYTLQLYDMQGKLLATKFYDHPTFRLFRSQIPAGILAYRLAADGRPVAAGKLIRN